MYLQTGGLRSTTNFRTHKFTASFSTEKARDIAIDLGGQFLWYRDFDVSDVDLLPGCYDYDFGRDKFLSAFARFQFDRRDEKNFPTHGSAFDGQFNYYLNRLFQPNGRDFSSVSVHYTNVFPMGKRMACILTVDNRTLLGSDVPVALGNVMGGALAGRYIDQQLPFIGFGYSHLFKNVLSNATLDLRYRMFDNHYFFLSGSYALAFQNLKTVFEDGSIYGARLGYAYNSFIGPLALDVYWSNYIKQVGVYVSLGYNF
jgi:NTE family protein